MTSAAKPRPDSVPRADVGTGFEVAEFTAPCTHERSTTPARAFASCVTRSGKKLGLAALALGLAVTATQIRPSVALPLMLGGFIVGALGVRALWRRWDLVDRLAGERDAYVIPEVLKYASLGGHDGEALRHGHVHPRLARRAGFQPRGADSTGERRSSKRWPPSSTDDGLELDPACAVACQRLLSDLGASPLLNASRPPEELRSRVRQIRAGFMSSRSAA